MHRRGVAGRDVDQNKTESNFDNQKLQTTLQYRKHPHGWGHYGLVWYHTIPYHTIHIMYGTVPVLPTRHLGANNGYASNNRYFIIKNYTFFSTTKCRVGGLKVEVVDQYIKISMLVRWVPEDSH